MASIFELGDIPSGLLPTRMGLVNAGATAGLSVINSYNVIIRGVPTANATYTTSNAAAIVAAIGGDCVVGTTFQLVVINASTGAFTITIAGGTNVTVSGVATVAQNASKIFLGRVTDVTAGSEEITLYGLGSTASAAA